MTPARSGPARSDISKPLQWTTTVLIVQASLGAAAASLHDVGYGRGAGAPMEGVLLRADKPNAGGDNPLPPLNHFGACHNAAVEAPRTTRKAENYLPNSRRHQLRRGGKSK